VLALAKGDQLVEPRL